jgi:hypothetical protein
MRRCRISTGAVGFLSAEKAFAEKTVAIELSPISAKSSLDDLEAPTESSNDSNRAVKELERLRQEEVCALFGLAHEPANRLPT